MKRVLLLDSLTVHLVTVQEVAVVLGRMLNYMDVDSKTTDKVFLADLNRVSDYAKDSIQYLASHDFLVSGQEARFNPINN